jgi:tRNA (guanine-N7-)-methyltransferase
MSLRRSPRLPPEALAPYLLVEGGERRVEGKDNLPPSTLHPPPSTLSPLDWRAVFGNDRPVEMEVGFGKGLFLLTAASACPDVNFVGIEIVRKYQLFTATRLAKRGLGNVRVACADARVFLPHHVAADSLQAVHVYFPDPWWKKRHHKRRLFTDAFAREVARILVPGGQLHFVSDVEEYHRTVVGVVAEQTPLRPMPPPEAHAPSHDLDYLTNFERKFRKEGRPIYRSRWVKPDVPV